MTSDSLVLAIVNTIIIYLIISYDYINLTQKNKTYILHNFTHTWYKASGNST